MRNKKNTESIFCRPFLGFRVICAALLSLALLSCGGQKTKAQGEALRLKNGIPVYYKNVDSTKMASILICIKGGSLAISRDFSGIESQLLELMSRASEKYSYEDLRRLALDKSISIGHGSTYAGSYFTLTCLSSYLKEALDPFLDCFLNPAFDQKQFENMLTECEQGLQQMENNPESLLFYTMAKEIYKGSPLESSTSVLPESRENITMENLKAHYKKIIDAKRIFIVAAGDVNLKTVRSAFEKSLAKIPSLEENFESPKIPELKIQGQKISLKSPALSTGSGHIALVFKSPALDSADLIVARIAASMFSESLFNVVRTKYGACYTPSSSVGFAPEAYGSVFLYRVSDMQKALSYVPEAEENFLQSDIEGNLEGFVKKYVNSAYQNQMTCASIAARSATALLTYGDIDAFDKLAQDAKTVRAADIRRVFKEYWQSNDKRVFEISGE